MTTRADQRRARQRARTAEKLRRASGPAGYAAVSFDEARKFIARDPDPVRRDNRWKRLAELLGEFVAELDAGDRR
jgi:hypothetical protein